MKKRKYLISAEKYEELKNELERLITVGRKDITQRLSELQTQTIEELDDPYAAVNEDKQFLEKRISEINDILKNYEILDSHTKHKSVEIGSKVRVGFESYEETYEIVDPVEADPIDKKISSESPVGKALLGSKVGDEVTVMINMMSHNYRVLDID